MKFSDFFTAKNRKHKDTESTVPLHSGRIQLDTERIGATSVPIPPAVPGAMLPKIFPPAGNKGAAVLWVSRETDEQGQPLSTRIPRARKRTTHIFLPFRLGSSHYPHFRHFLDCRQTGSPFFRDMYGRRIFHYSERFPCFDSYDYLHDHRRFHWFYLFLGEQLTCVYYADECGILEITSDVEYIPERHWKEMVQASFLT